MPPKTKIICGCVLLLPFIALNADEIKQITKEKCSPAAIAQGNIAMNLNCSKKI